MRSGTLLLALLIVPSLVVGVTAPASCRVPQRHEALACSYVVAPTGSDANNGRSATTAFATLERARAAARHGSSSVVCLRAGTYHLHHPLALTPADSGETWQYYPPDGVDTAVLDGGNDLSGGLIYVDGARNVTINGLKLRHFVDYGILIGGRQSGNSGATVENCDIGFNTITSWNSAGIASWAATDVTIAHNYVHDLGSQGILVSEYENAKESIAGTVIVGNVVLNAVQRMSDGGAIYISMHGGEQGPANAVLVTNNYVANYGAPGVSAVHGIYLDDNANNVRVTRNVVAPPRSGAVSRGNNNDTSAFFIHNGHDNHISGNIVDLGDSGQVAVAIWGHDSGSIAGMSGNSFTGNIVVSSYTGAQQTNAGGVTGYAYYGPGSASVDIQGNVYHNYAGGQVSTSGYSNSGDTSPIFQDPQLSGSRYTVASGSPIVGGPAKFRPIAGGWGPPGFVLPRSAIDPSPR